jgi:hypothetical protein
MDLLTNTPWWVYALLLALFLVGLRAMRRRTVSLEKILLLPFLFTLLNFVWLNERLKNRHLFLFLWIVGLGLGLLVGWWMARKWMIKRAPGRNRISLPPTPSALVLIVLFFVIRYLVIYTYETHTSRAVSLFIVDALVSGGTTGVFIGRACQIFYKYKKAV